MQNESKPRLDKKDGKLLYLLDLNAREPLTSLAKKLHLSEEGLSYRLKRLQESGIIKGFHTIIDVSALGYIGGGYYIKLQHADEKKENEMLDYFREKENVFWLDSRGGEYDLGVGIWTKDIHEFHKFEEEFMEKFRPNINKTRARIFDEVKQFSRAYLCDGATRGKNESISLWNGKIAEYDKTDYAILKLISTNARLPTVELARRLSLTPMVVKYRIKKMETAGVIKGYKPVLDLSKLGYFWYKIDFLLSDYSMRGELAKFASSHPNIIYTYDAIGGVDFEIELEVSGAEQLLQIIRQMRFKFSKVIVSTDYFLWTAEHRIAYLP